MVDSWYYVEKYQRKRVAGYCYQEKLRQMFLNWMLQSKEFNPENFNTSAINLKDMLRNKSFMAEITGKLAHQNPQGNMQKLFDCKATF